jgi:hypothetical protein
MTKKVFLQIIMYFFVGFILFGCSNGVKNSSNAVSKEKRVLTEENRENKAFEKLEIDVDVWRKKLGTQISSFNCSRECQSFVQKFADSKRLKIFLSEYEKCILKSGEQEFLSCVEISNKKIGCSLSSRDCISMNAEAWMIIHSVIKSTMYNTKINDAYDNLLSEAKIFCSNLSTETKENDIFYLENCKNTYYYQYATPYN